jgi:kynurenine formamidase
MKIHIDILETQYCIDTSRIDVISIPMNFHGSQPNTYDVDKASAKAYEAGSFIGDTRRGGGCNFEEYRLITHCNGTHTECAGHISFDRIHVNRFVNDLLIPSTLISIEPLPADRTEESYDPPKNTGDLLITAGSLKSKLKSGNSDFLNGLIIRTLPNSEEKLRRQYSRMHPPFFSAEAMEYIVEIGVDHLLIDIPSVDRTFDEGRLTAHHIFWNVPLRSHEIDAGNCSRKTITEMIFADNRIPDGRYFTSIQIPDFMADAAPSRVLIYPLC